ncbi:MAG: carbohydrate-binding domain-containing protein [Clostridia bacterium]|nr:carbohydrate-binding domain-containing protein [Clostridia bacterium]
MKRLFLILLILTFSLSSCGNDKDIEKGAFNPNTTNSVVGDDNTAFGDDISDELNEGYFEDITNNVEISLVSGTPDAYRWEENTLIFDELTDNSVYSISGQLTGSIIIDIGEEYKLDLELCGLSIVGRNTNPITVLSGDKVKLTAKNGYESYVYDKRDKVDSQDEGAYSSAIYSLCDLEIAGKGALTVSSDNNNGIHSKKDLKIKNLTLTVNCNDNALKGNDSVTIEGGKTTLIATMGDGIKTTNSDVSTKGNQKGTVTITGGEHTIYSACDGIDSAYNVEINDEATILNIYTDKYSNHSKEITTITENAYYVRFTSDSYKYSIKYYNSENDYFWVNSAYHSTVSSGRNNYYYYALEKRTEYSKIKLFIYSTNMEQGQENEYIACTDYMAPNIAYDTIALSARMGGLSYGWTNYTTNIQEGMGDFGGMGGMNDGNTEKGSYSTKGIKASNEIIINQGNIVIKAYDDAIHCKIDEALENGKEPLGNLTINGGGLTLYSNDDGLHADGSLSINDGKISIVNSYEGVEGLCISINGGCLSVIARDDGINSTTNDGTGIIINDGCIYIYCNGDGIDANTKSSYGGIVFTGGNTVVISTSGGNSALDTERGYKYTGGRVVAIMPSGGMTQESTNCDDFTSIGKSLNVSVTLGEYITISVDGTTQVAIKMPLSINGKLVYLGSSSPKMTIKDDCSYETDANGIYWK